MAAVSLTSSKAEGSEEDGGGWGDGVVEFGDSGEGG